MLGEQFVSAAYDLNLTLIDNYYKRGNAAAVLGTIKAKHTDYYG